MKIKTKRTYAIYKNSAHLGNEKGISKKDAIQNYLVASKFTELINNKKHLNKYSAKLAINGVHHYLIKK